MGKKVERTRNCGTMTEAGFRSWIISGLRKLTQRWKPKSECIKKAKQAAREIVENNPDKHPELFYGTGNVKRGIFLCAGCKTVQEVGKRSSNCRADHIKPICGEEGFTTYDAWIEGAFIEEGGWQCLCKKCDDAKQKTEREMRKEYRRKNK